ncbi:MAG: serine/threonine protein kinase [Verrucomicrobiales bacterium]|jgi:serine/threonine protein kinase
MTSLDSLESGGAARSASQADTSGWTVPSLEQLRGKVAGYEFNDILGRGGMGAVYRAQQRSLDRSVAIKILRPVAEDGLFLAERFENEARTMARLNHPNIVDVLEFGQTQDGEIYYIVMEFVEGKDLAVLIDESDALPQEAILAIASEVCEALAYAHSQGVIHRDIKPANILLSTERKVKVADFGLAKVIDGSTSRHAALTQCNMALGTPAYAAPEVIAAEGVPDQRADIFSLGVVLYQMLTGELPRGMFMLPSEMRPDLDGRFDTIVCKAMDPERDGRYQSAKEIGNALAEIGGGSLQRSDSAASKPRRRLSWRNMAALAVLTTIALVSVGVLSRSLTTVNAPVAADAGKVEGWINLFEGLGVEPRGLTDTWSMLDGELRSPESAILGHQTIELPTINPPLNYDMRVRLTRHRGEAAVMLAFRHGDAGGSFRLDSWTGEGRTYLARFFQITGEQVGATHRQQGFYLPVGSPHEIIVQVRDARITASFDGQQLVSWKADWSRIAQTQPESEGAFFPPGAVDHPIFGVGVCAADVTFHSVELHPR